MTLTRTGKTVPKGGGRDTHTVESSQQPLIVVKYDGVSIATASQIRDLAKHVASLSAQHRVALVCSATGSTTDELVEIGRMIKKGDGVSARRRAARITSRHRRLARDVLAGGQRKETARKRLAGGIDSDGAELTALIDGMVLLGEVTPGMMDNLLSFGERMSVRLIAGAISDSKRRGGAVPLTGQEAGIITDSGFGDARPLLDTTRLRVAAIVEGIISDGAIPVVGGFVGADQHGRITTLGRGGSDYTATIIGSCIGADEIWLMGAVDGLATADPHTVPGASIIRHVSYAEAVEMALFGAKQIHPRTFEPVLSARIPMRIRSSKNIADSGTLVTASPPPDVGNTIKCVSGIKDCGIVDIQGASMVGMPGTAARIFTTLAEAGVNVMMISQNPSESSITVVVRSADLGRAANALELRLLGKIIKRLDVTVDMTIIALIGAGMRGTVGVASKVFAAMGSAGINVAMITQGSSELNLAFVVRNNDGDDAVRALHDTFELGEGNSG